ncbi:MAG: hypothetical protein JWO32_2457 [Bacteroidetes bacterium]|nr:hypothetical protein [Bacteroidota bacterium]
MLKKSRLYSILFNKCPRCHKGNFFVSNNPYDLKRFSKLNDDCPVCNESFRREPGFYFGATYASYGITVFLGLTLFLFMVWFLKIEILIFLVTFLILLIVLMPVIYRLSRLIWINVFVSPGKTDLN